MNIGNFVVFNSYNKGTIIAIYDTLFSGDEWEETFLIRIIESNHYPFNKIVELPYYVVDLITDGKEINRLNKIMVYS